MPRYHFNISDGVSLPDTEGTELPDIEAAKVAAIKMAGVIISEQADHFRSGEDWFMSVTDEKGLILFRLDFNMTLSAATKK